MIQTLRASRTKSLRDLSSLYYAGEHCLALKNEKSRKCRRANIDSIFLDYAPTSDSPSRPKAPRFGDLRLATHPIQDDELAKWKADLLARYEQRPHVLNRTASYVRSMLKWLVAEHYLPADKIPELPRAAESVEKFARNVTLDATMLRALWKATDLSLQGAEDRLPVIHPHEAAFVRLLLLTGQRRDVIAKLQWSEVKKQEEIPHLLFQQTRSKNGKAYMVPVTAEILEVIDNCKRFAGHDYVVALPAAGDGRPLTAFTHIKEKLDARMRADIGAAFTPWRFHDLRRVMRSTMAQLGIDARVAELCLAHSPSWETKAEPHYNVYAYVLEKADAMRRYNGALMRKIYPERYKGEEHRRDDLSAKLAALDPSKLEALFSILGASGNTR